MKKFKMWDYNHISFYQDLRQFEICFHISKDNDDEYNWILKLSFVFWMVELAWNGRKENKQ